MNGNSGAMSPVSVDGSDWSGINQYQKSEPPFSPTFSHRSNLATPPTSGVPSGSLGPNGVNGTGGGGAAAGNGGASGSGLLNGSLGRLSDSGNPSPPSSVAGARSSGDGTAGPPGTADQRSRRYRQMEEVLGQHYTALKRFLHAPYRDDRSAKAKKARDKLLRLSPTQFHELSTDVYDELLRRQQAMPPSPGRAPRPDVPPHLLPRTDFHEKRNQARQKLASLQHPRFRDLATDVFCELEHRFPQFAGRDSRHASPAPSFRGRPSNGYGPPNGYPPPLGARRSQSRGPRMGRGYSSSGPGSPMSGGFPPRQGSMGGPPPSVTEEPALKAFQSNMIVPNKSTMVEDDDDAVGTEDDFDARSDAFGLEAVLSRRDTATTLGDGERKMLVESQSQVSVLQEKVDRLEELVRSKDEELLKHQNGHETQASNAERQEWDELKSDLESKISKAVDLNSSLQQELVKVRSEQDNMERDLRNQLDEASRQGDGGNGGGGGGDPDLRARFADLEIKHQTLQIELQDQQQVTEEVRREASTFLMEMRTLSEQSHSNWEREEQLSNEVHRLEEEVKQWKGRYAKAKTQLRHLRASSVGISDARPDVSSMVAKDHELLQEHGLIKDVHVTKFQISIDELLRIARYDGHRLVMSQVQTVVIAIRYILQDVQTATAEPGDGPAAQLRTKATRKVSATANNLITASKNFANSSGLSPVSLLDAAASHLSTAVIEIVHLVKIRASPQDELEDVHEEQEEDINVAQLKSPDYFSVAPSQSRHSNNDNESIYSAIHPPSDHSRGRSRSNTALSDHDDDAAVNGWTHEPRFNYAVNHEHELQEVKLYVEDQTEGLVQSIQALVSSIRAEEDLSMIRTHISAISSVVTNVASSTEHLIHKPDVNPTLRERSGPIVQTLEYHRGRLTDATAEGDSVSSAEELHAITNKLPPIAFEIARETKELVQRLNPAQYDEDEDDFR